MSTASFPVPNSPQRSNPLKRACLPSGASTSAAADEALRRIIDGHLASKRFAADQPRSEGAVSAALSGWAETIRESIPAGSLARQAPKAIAVALVAIMLAGATYRIVSRDRTLHGVAGSVRVGEAPLANGILEFHRKSQAAGDAPFSTVIHTDAQGAFRRAPAAGLPPGTYAIVVHARRPRAADARRPSVVATPAQYAAMTSTPLSVEINGANTALDLVIQ
ncbi:MAG: hypothetical protein WCR51_04110 [Planctomycetia bacterium]